jgi:dolichol-phosphate mannosyltransferase
LKRAGKQGLGKAYLAGMGWGLQRGYDIIVTMDADFSHRPLDLVKILDQFKDPKIDLAIGSRYVAGGSTVNWGLLRKIISRGGSIYARLVLRYPLRDWTGGFNAYRRRVLEKIHLETIESTGYCFQIEMKFRSLLFGFKHIEVPIVFEDRRVGQSKMSGAIFLEALLRVWTLRLQVAASLKNELLR